MPGIPPDLNRRLREVLARCGPFGSNEELATIFINSRIYPWRGQVPEASTPIARIGALISTLWEKNNLQGENALVLFLIVLTDHPGPATQCDLDLNELARDLTDVLAQETRPTPPASSPPRPVIGGGAEIREFDADQATDTLEPSRDVNSEGDDTQRQPQGSEKQGTKTEEVDETTGNAQPIPFRAWVLLALIALDLCMIVFWGWCLIGDNANLMSYLQTAGTLIGLPLAVLAFLMVTKRPIILENALHCLGTSSRWLWVVICLTLVCIAISALFWPLGIVGQCVTQPTAISRVTDTPPSASPIVADCKEQHPPISGINLSGEINITYPKDVCATVKKTEQIEVEWHDVPNGVYLWALVYAPGVGPGGTGLFYPHPCGSDPLPDQGNRTCSVYFGSSGNYDIVLILADNAANAVLNDPKHANGVAPTGLPKNITEKASLAVTL